MKLRSGLLQSWSVRLNSCVCLVSFQLAPLRKATSGLSWPGPRLRSVDSSQHLLACRGLAVHLSTHFSFPPLLLQPCRFSPLYSTASDSTEDSYVPMRPSTSPSAPGSDCSPDGYIPMSPSSATFTFPVVSTEKLTSPLPELPSDLEPPPVNRDLKPRRKCKL